VKVVVLFCFPPMRRLAILETKSILSAVEISGFSVVRASLPAQARRARRPAALCSSCIRPPSGGLQPPFGGAIYPSFPYFFPGVMKKPTKGRGSKEDVRG
jgi:hypothetical protein